MADEADGPDKAPWTIKAVPVETRKLAGACAVKQGQTMAEWLAVAVRNQANLEAGERVFPPDKPGNPAGRPNGGLPVSSYGLPGGQTIVLGELAAAMEAAKGLAEAAGIPVPAGMAREGFATVRQMMRQARGVQSRIGGSRRERDPKLIEG